MVIILPSTHMVPQRGSAIPEQMRTRRRQSPK
jgi:hypothetical protein